MEQPTATTWNSVNILLAHPVSGPDGAVFIVTMREPDIEALEKIDNLGITSDKPMKVSQIKGVIVALTGLPEAVVNRIHRDDFTAIGEAAVPLLEAVKGGDS